MEHNCIIGLRNDYENTELVTVEDLQEHITKEKTLLEQNKNNQWLKTVLSKYTLSDYFDRRKSTDLTRFNHCPFCGKKIDWRALKSTCKEGI